MKFIYYSKVDLTKEVVNRVDASSLKSAINIFAKIKQLSIPNFLKLFNVDADEKSKREDQK
jgi:hypothetical protein